MPRGNVSESDRVERDKPFGGGGPHEVAVGAGEGDLESFLLQEQGACEMDGVGTSERMARAETGHEREDGSADGHLRELLPIAGEGKLELLELGCLQKLFPPSPHERRMDLGKREDRSRHRFPLCHNLTHTLRARLGDVELDQSAGVEEENQRRSSLTISEANLPRLGKEGP